MRTKLLILFLLLPFLAVSQLAETNVTTTAIKTALSESTNDLKLLCISTSVNKWSRKKPVRIHNATPADWYKALDGDFGLDIPSIQLPSLVYNSSNAWTYEKPNDANSYREGDFRGYLHSSLEMVYTSTYPTGSYGSLETSPQWVYTKNITTSLGITPADLSLDTYYYGIMVEWIASGYTNRWAITDSYTIGVANKNNLVTDLTAAPFVSTTIDGTFRWTSFISASSMTSWTDLTTAPNYTVVPTSGTNTGTFTVYKQNFDITPTSSSYAMAQAGETYPTAPQWGVDTWSTNGWTATIVYTGSPLDDGWCYFWGGDTSTTDSGTGDGGVTVECDAAGIRARSATLTFVDTSGTYPDVVKTLTQVADE